MAHLTRGINQPPTPHTRTMDYRPQLLTTELAALATGVKPGTIRQWRYLQLLTPAGGTPRRPLYNLTDVINAKTAPKPRTLATLAKAA